MSEILKYRDVKKIVNLTNMKISEIRKQIETKINDTTVFTVSDTFDFSKVKTEYHRYIFYYHELEFNILDNLMVPKHKKISNMEKVKDQLPKIKTYDPVVRRMNFQLGDVIECRYLDTQSYYRVVSE